MRRKHHRRYQRRFTRLASRYRSLFILVWTFLALLSVPGFNGSAHAQSATYRVTFEGKFTASALASGVAVPSGEHFTTLIGAVHNGSVTFWSSGAMASAGVEQVTELGTTGTFKSEINGNMNAVAVIEKSLPSGGTPTATVDFTVTTAHPLVTLLTMVAPSPDWFVGVSGLSLLDAQGDWLASHTVDLFPYDAGTEEGTEFSLSNAATSPQGTIASIKGTGKFSDEPIATLTFTLQSVTPEITSAATFTVDEGTKAVETLTAKDQDSAAADLAWSKAGGADAGQFTLSSGGELTFTTAPDYENPGDADGDNVYEVTVQVSDGDNTDTKDVVVTVKNMDEDGTVSLFPASLRVRTVVRPTLSDPDGGISAVAWQWARSSDEINWADIGGAVQADYLPTHSDKVQYLRATARYTDGEGAGKTAVAASEATVGAREPGPELSVKTLVSGLRYPWGIAFTPDGTMLFTERDGHRQQDPLPDPPEGLSSQLTDGTLQTVSADFSDLDTDENGGVMGLEVDPDFVDNRRIYICQQRTGSVIQVVAWTIDATYTTATRANDPLVGNIPRVDNHNGCRLRFGPDGNLWISTGDTEVIGTVPQDLNSLGGKILRVDPLTGAAPADNPFPGSLVYSYGHRNPQGLALRPGTRQMWSVEHGPTVDDEINLLVPGANYGWDPVPTDENGDPTSGYDDTAPMTDLVKFPGAIEARWSSGNPTLATSGGIFLEGEQWGLWEGRLAVATLKGRSLRIFEFTEDGTFVSHVVPEELDHFGDRDHRLRTPMIGPDNALYLSTSTRGWRDEILRVTPQQAPEFPNDADTRQVTENTGGDMVVATVEATDYNHDELTYTLGGTDGESFYILDENIGELRVRSTTQLDYETKREYEVTVTATDAQDTSDTVTLTIEVTDVEHEGTVSLPLTQPRVGSPVQASLSDPDGGVTGTTWQWERSDDGVTGWEDIDGARSASYTPGTDDIGKYLRATVTYTNIHGPGKTAQSVTSSAVSAAPNSNPEFPSASVVRRVAEHTAEGQRIGSRVEADDADGDPLQYALSGMDGNLFSINSSSGQLLTRAALDYEMANEYEVDVSVSDGKDTNAVSDDNKVDDSVRVTIEVTNVDEPGTVSLLPAQLRVWTVVRATLSDPDGVDLHAVSWQWVASSDGVSWMPVPAPEGTQADYAPTDIVQGQYLRATASYTDGQGTGKRAEVVSDNVVGERESGPELTVVPLVSGLSVPWGVAFAPDGTMLFTERGDRLSSRLTDGTVQSVSADFDDLLVSGEAGLMAIVVDPAFASNRRFYTCQAHTGPEVQVIAWTLNATYTAATRADDPLVGNIPATSRHSGCRLRFGPEGYLWIATGDASAGTVPQDRNSLGGKVLRVNSSTGAAAPGNPFGTRVYTYGHRNPQGLALRPGTNQMWSVEHGPTVDDEINLLSSGGNYGWDPVPGYNESVPMTDLGKFPDAVEARWSSGDPTLATSGGIFLEGADWEEWNGRLAIATLKGRSLRVFEFSASGVFMSHVVAPGLDGAYGRLRTPMLGPDGALYVTTSNGRGQDKILRVSGSRAPAFLTDTETRKVGENNDISTFVAKVLALDSDGDTLTYTLSGPDAESFSIPDDTVGAMWANVAFDYETKRSYEVTVTATDPQGLNDSTTLTITVTDTDEPPMAPGAPMVSARTGTTDSLSVTWTAPDNTGPAITDYDVRYREGGSGGFTDAQHEGPGLSLTLANLEAGTAYEVQVRAANDEGTSDWSESGEGMTVTPLTVPMTSDLPPPVESAFAVRFSFSEPVRGFTSSDIVTRQEPPCTDSANNPVFCNPSFTALQTTDDRIFTTTVAPRTDQVAHNYTLTLTVPAGRVTSAAGNKPNEEARLEMRVAPPGVTVPISSISLRANAGNGQVTLRWSTPDNSGGAAIVRYEYRWAESGGEFGEWMRVAAAERSVTVPNLTNGTEYVFEVRGVNDLGYGDVETVRATPRASSGGFVPPPRPPQPSNFPMADAGPDQTGVWEGALVTLDGSGSSDPDDDPLRYRWNQLSGERVVLSSRNVVNPTFTAPEGLTADAVLQFRLLVTDPIGRFDSDTVTVTVNPDAEPPPPEDLIYYFPHLAVGEGWQTTITYINYSSEEVSCRTEFLSDQGTPLLVSFADRGTVPSRTDVLQPGESVHEETNVALSAPLAPGWARATCSGPVKASLLFRRHNSEGVPTAEAGVNATRVPATRFVTFAEQGEGKFGTGVAYANPSDTAALLTFTARDADGETLASVDKNLSPNGHAAQNVAPLFGLSSFTGSLEVTSTEPIVTLSLNFEAAPVFSSLPPGELDAAAQGATTYYFPHLAVGAGWQTTITYINYSPQEVSCQTEFLSDHGSPLLVSFAGLGTVVSRTDVLPPGGSVHEETNVELSAPPVAGWARATCSGPVKASLLYRRFEGGVPTGEAGVNAVTVPATRFVTFAEQGEGKHGTGVAYANPSDTTTAFVTFTVRDADGRMLASVDVTLLPNGHDAQNMQPLFGLPSFTGSLEVTSTEPIVSLSLNVEADPVFSSLPPGELDAAAQGSTMSSQTAMPTTATTPDR